MNLKDLIFATDGHIVNFRDMNFSGISIDSRTIERGEVFIAVKGKKFNGHDFLADAIDREAVCVVVSDRSYMEKTGINSKRIPILIVADTIKALGDIAHYHRKRFDVPVIAVTGSTGKTTVKEIISCLLASEYRVLKNEGTKNNLIGLPLTLLKLRRRHDVCVLELGTSRPGEISRLSEICAPSIGVITNIGHSHLEYLGNIRNVSSEKCSLLKYLGRNAHAVLNKDDVFLSRAKTNCQTLYFGLKRSCDYYAEHVLQQNREMSFKVRNVRFNMSLLGGHNVYNALAAIAIGQLFGMSLGKISSLLEKFRNSLGDRLSFYRMNGISVLNDTYNSNPLSLRSAIESFKGVKHSGRKVVVSADMLELGKKSISFHRLAGKMIAFAGIDLLITVGKLSRHTSRSALWYGMHDQNVFHFNTPATANSVLNKLIRKDDFVLVKGSRSMHMEEVFRKLGKLELNK